MEAITKYRAIDGSEWHNAAEAEAREELIARVAGAMSHLKPRPENDGCSFTNGSGYIQQSESAVNATRRALFEIADTKGILKDWINSQRENHGRSDDYLAIECHVSWFERMLDGGHAPLSRAYSRLGCIDGQFREWGQPYFANHTGEAKNVCLA